LAEADDIVQPPTSSLILSAERLDVRPIEEKSLSCRYERVARVRSGPPTSVDQPVLDRIKAGLKP
jgi:hypothetical protein